MKIRNAVLPLLIANVAMFFLQILLGDWFTNNLILASSDILTRPWIMITSMFLHANPNHIFFNMFALYMFGPVLEQRIGTKRFLFMYFMSGIVAAIAFALTPFGEYALGASGAIMGMLGATIVLMPDLKVLFFFVVPMSLRTAGMIFVAIDILGLFGVGIPGVANVAHLGGLAAGAAYGYYLKKKARDFGRRFTGMRGGSKKSIRMTRKDMEDYLRNGRL